MNYKHHQATVTRGQELANQGAGASFSSYLNVYDTRFTYQSNGIDYYAFDEARNSDGDVEAPIAKSPSGSDLVSSGKMGNIILDWEGGGPEGTYSPRWQILLQGHTWGSLPTTSVNITFKAIYSGNLVLSVNTNTVTNYASTSPTGQLDQVLINDWDYTSGSEVKSVTTSTVSLNGAGAITAGGMDIRARYWNGTESPHLLLFIKREGVDEDFVLMGPSSLTTYATNFTSPIAATQTQITDLVSWKINRDHDQITKADVIVFVDDATDPNAYDPDTESFGELKKGAFVELFAGYNGDEIKRFVGNIIGGTELSRTKHGAEILLQCEAVSSALIDTVNFSFPNNATYSYSEYYSDQSMFVQPDGLTRPRQFDQWNLTSAIKSVALQSGVDSYYLNGTRKYFNREDTTYTSDTPLIRDIGINLSRPSINPRENVNAPELDPIWVYDFGQDTAYDIIKDMLSKYGYYLAEIGGGTDCGKIEVIEVQSPVRVHETLDAGASSSYTEGIKRESLEGFLGVQMDAGSSTLVLDWTGKSLDVLMGIGPSYSDSVTVTYKVASGDADWTAIGGYFNDGTYIGSSTINTEDNSLSSPRYYYDGISQNTGQNPCVFKLAFGINEFGFLDTDIPYGEHKLRLTKSSSAIALFDSILEYDFGNTPYKRYSTYDAISSLSSGNAFADIRNDIVVLGATYGAYSHVADPEILEEVKDRYITSRVTDARSIYDPTYKYYVGRRKQFVIEDPTIVTQERADWLALYVLQEYRQTPTNTSFAIPADLGLQLYDGVLVEDVKTESHDKYKNLKVESISESFDQKSYTTKITGSSRIIPISYRPRQQLTPELVALHFNNCPIAFEKMWLPVLDGNSGYDPMSSEDGVFIEFEWTQLVPGKINMEVFDKGIFYHSGDDIRGPNYGQGSEDGGFSDKLLAVPYIAQSETIGKYVARWDGVHEYYGDPKFNGTLYQIDYMQPQGSGFFCRGVNSPLIDSVDAVALEEGDDRAARVCYFPAYPVVKYQPTIGGFENVLTVYHFGEANGSSQVNGVDNPTDDTSMFEIEEFDMEARRSLFWGFNEDYIMDPEDKAELEVNINHPYQLGDDASSVIHDTLLPISLDTTHKILKYDPRLPYGSDGTHSAISGYITRTMPLIDDTIGIRIFVDEDTPTPRRYKVYKADIIFNVITQITDALDYYTSEYTVVSLPDGAMFYLPAPSWAKRNYNFTCRQQAVLPITRFHNSVQRVVIGEWTYLPGADQRADPESEMFRFNPSHADNALNDFENETIRYSNSSIAGIGVCKLFATTVDKVETFDPEQLVHRLYGEKAYVPYKATSFHHSTFGSQANVILKTEFFFPHEQGNNNEDDVYFYPPSIREYVRVADGVANHNGRLTDYVGRFRSERKIWNAIVVSLDFQIIDRAGRLYHCTAKADEGQFLVGKHNEVESHSRYGRDMLPYVNRWNPYLPTACYRERQLDGWALDNFMGPYLDFLSTVGYDNITETSLEPDFGGSPLNTKVFESGLTLSGILLMFSSAYPVWPVRQHNAGAGIPVCSNTEWSDGKEFAYFGTMLNQYNSYAYIADGVEAISSRDHTHADKLSSWGLPLYIIGGYPYEDLVHPSFQSRAGGTYNNWYRYLTDRDRYGQAMSIDHQRAGLASFLNNSPVFTFVGGHRFEGTLNYHD